MEPELPSAVAAVTSSVDAMKVAELKEQLIKRYGFPVSCTALLLGSPFGVHTGDEWKTRKILKLPSSFLIAFYV